MTVGSAALDASHYGILKLDLSASQKEVRTAYMREALIHHPDKQLGDSTGFLKVQEAYNTLGDDRQRATYDKKLCRSKGAPLPMKNISPKAKVLAPFIVTCRDRVLRTLDTHDSRFDIPLRHGDIIETDHGIGMVMGMFDCDVYWIPSGSRDAELLATRDELRNPGVGGVQWKKPRTTSRVLPRTAGSMRGSSLMRGVKKSPEERAAAERRRVGGDERAARDKLEGALWEQLADVLITCQSEWEVMFVRQRGRSSRTSYNALNSMRSSSRTMSRPTSAMRRTTSSSFRRPSPSPAHAAPRASTPRASTPRVSVPRASTPSRSAPVTPKVSSLRASTPRGRVSDAPLASNSASSRTQRSATPKNTRPRVVANRLNSSLNSSTNSLRQPLKRQTRSATPSVRLL